MRTLTLVVLLLFAVPFLFAQEGEKAETKSVTFKRKVPKAGVTEVAAKAMDMSMSIEVIAGGAVAATIEMTEAEVEKTTTKVLESGEKVTKVSVTYDESEKRSSHSQQGDREEAAPVVGKSYVVEVKDGALVITAEGEDVESPGEGELEHVRKDQKGLLRDDPMQKFFDGRTFKVGEAVTLPQETIDELMDDENGPTVTEFTLTLKETSEAWGFPCGVFDVVLKMTMVPEEGMEMTFDLKGLAISGIENCWLVKLDVEGPVKMTGGDAAQGYELNGNGTMAITETSEFKE